MGMMSDMPDKERTEVTVVMYNLIFTNEVATGAVCDLLELVEEREGLCRQKVKFWSGRCREDLRGYNRLLDRRTGGMIGFVADLNDMYDEVVRMDVWKLGNVVRMTLGRGGCADVELTARLWLARVLTACSVNNVEHCMESFPHLRYLQRKFGWMGLRGLLNCVEHLRGELLRRGVCEAVWDGVLEADGQVETGMRALAVRLHDGDGIIQVCNRHAAEWEEEHGL